MDVKTLSQDERDIVFQALNDAEELARIGVLHWSDDISDKDIRRVRQHLLKIFKE